MNKELYLEVCDAHASSVRNTLSLLPACCFTLQDGNRYVTMVVTITIDFITIGEIAFGGSPEGRVWVGILGRGSFHFAKETVHWGYFEEKLGLNEADAMVLARFWELIWEKKD